MELQGERLIPADVQRTWNALNDPAILKACIPGCESVERTGENSYESVVAVKVGPVGARFKGKINMTNVDAPKSYTINFDGQGGAAGFGKGAADVSLVAEGSSTRLSYQARASVGGKMAQIGSRLVDAAAQKMTEDFFTRFEQALAPPAAAPAGAAPVPAAGAGVPTWVWWVVAAIVVAGLLYVVLR
jgi:carbon monoxide dehydrogenase subunit G